jgi:hypothetical protein
MTLPCPSGETSVAILGDLGTTSRHARVTLPALGYPHPDEGIEKVGASTDGAGEAAVTSAPVTHIDHWRSPATAKATTRSPWGPLHVPSCGFAGGRKGAGLIDPVPHHGPRGDHHGDSGHNAERNGEDRDPEGVAVLPRLQ